MTSYDGTGLYLNARGELVDVWRDADAPSPREDCPYGTFLTFHRGHFSPDENPYRYVDELAESLGMPDPEDASLFDVIAFLNEHGNVALPVSMLDHSGIRYATGDPRQFVGAWPWDAGYVGLIWAPEQDGPTRDDVRDWLRASVDEYDGWASGDCYGFTVYAKDGTELDCRGFFYGDDFDANGLLAAAGPLSPCPFDDMGEWLAA